MRHAPCVCLVTLIFVGVTLFGSCKIKPGSKSDQLGIQDGNGFDTLFSDWDFQFGRDNPWFLGSEPFEYCVVATAGLEGRLAGLKAEVAKGFELRRTPLVKCG